MHKLVENLLRKVKHLEKTFRQQVEKMIHMQHSITELEKRVSQDERCYSKDCLILNNFPIKPRGYNLIDDT